MTKKIEAIIREDKFPDVKEALRKIGIVGMNVIEVRGHGQQGGIVLAGRTGTYQVDMLPKLQLNIILSDHNVEKTVADHRQGCANRQSGRWDHLYLPGRGSDPHPHRRARARCIDV